MVATSCGRLLRWPMAAQNMDDFDQPPVWQHRGKRYVTIAKQRRFKGSEFFDIRQYQPAADGALSATNRGLTIPLDAVASLGEALVRWTPEKA
jgi:Transcriptional Coactivator p15 (PC4)